MVEYNNSPVSGASCSYATLSNYNNSFQGMRPAISPTTVGGKYIVPSYASPGYNALTKVNSGNCTGYGTITSAYGADADTASTTYVYKLCE